MSEMAPLGAGFDLSIRGFGQASVGARARREVTAVCQTQRRGQAGSDGGHFFTAFGRLLWPSHPNESYVGDDGEDYDSDADSIPARAITPS
jgi:hypothetical protein